MAAKVLPFRDVQGELRDVILRIIHSWTKAQREGATTNGDAAALLAKGIIEAGYRRTDR